MEDSLSHIGELRRDTIAERLNRGDAVLVALTEGEPVGYAWLSFCNGMERIRRHLDHSSG